MTERSARRCLGFVILGKVSGVILIFLIGGLPSLGVAQQCTSGPGYIFWPATGQGVAVLDPNGDRCVSKGPPGFAQDDVAESEIPFIAVPLATPKEPLGDVNPVGGQSDLVDTAQGQQMLFVFYNDRGTSTQSDDLLLFRIRIGKEVQGGFGYSVLVDTDRAYGTGVDPNAVPGNLGFEAELRVATGGNSGVFIERIDGTTNGTTLYQYPLSTHSQRSYALTRNSNDADVFFDFYVPFADFAQAFGITPHTPVRFVAATAKSPGSVLGGSAADIGGVNDNVFPNDDEALGQAVTVVPPTPIGNLGEGGGFAVVNFASAAQIRGEGGGPFGVVVTLSRATTVDVSVPFVFSGTAANPADYTVMSGNPLLIQAGSTSGTLVLSPVADGLMEPDETIVITMGTPTGALRGSLVSHTVTLVECVGEGDCTSPRPVCDTSTHICVQCLTHAHCSGGTPVCNTNTRSCVRCMEDADCPLGATCTTNLCHLPPPVITDPPSGSYISNPRPTIQGTTAPFAVVTVFVDGTPVGTAVADDSGRLSQHKSLLHCDGGMRPVSEGSRLCWTPWTVL